MVKLATRAACAECKGIFNPSLGYTGRKISQPRIYCTRKCKHRAHGRSRDQGVTPEMARAYVGKKYGLDFGDYERMLTEQDGVCAVCRKPETKRLKGTLCSLSIDHCHETGQVRGLLCDACNVGIGRLGDDEALLLAAAAYISRSKTPNTRPARPRKGNNS